MIDSDLAAGVKALIIFADMVFNAPSDMEHGRQPAVLSQLLQDEDVSYHRGRPHEFWSGSEHLQLPVSAE